MLDSVKSVAGTSAGSMVAILLSLRYSAKEIKEIISRSNFKNFKDHWNPLRIRTKYGLYKGDYILSKIKKTIKNVTGNENITFSELSEQGYRDLKIFATDLNTTSVREFSNKNTPHVSVAESVRASISIPFFFSAWKFSNNNPNDHIYIDGGVVYNYPITAYDDLDKTLGFYIYNDQKQTSSLDYNELFQYLRSLYKAIMDSQDIDFNKEISEKKSTVLIDDLGISSTDFNITPEQEEQLFHSGFESTLEYIKNDSLTDGKIIPKN